MSQDPEEDGQIHTLGLLEQLRDESQRLWGSSSEFYFRVDGLLRELTNPNLHDIPTNPAVPSRDVGQPRPAYPLVGCCVSKRSSWTRGAECGDYCLSGRAVHSAERDFGDTTV